MAYKKVISDGFVVAVGTNIIGEDITESEYQMLLTIIGNKPIPPYNLDYKLRADTLEWQLVELPLESGPESSVEAKAEAYDILMGY